MRDVLIGFSNGFEGVIGFNFVLGFLVVGSLILGMGFAAYSSDWKFFKGKYVRIGGASIMVAVSLIGVSVGSLIQLDRSMDNNNRGMNGFDEESYIAEDGSYVDMIWKYEEDSKEEHVENGYYKIREKVFEIEEEYSGCEVDVVAIDTKDRAFLCWSEEENS